MKTLLGAALLMAASTVAADEPDLLARIAVRQLQLDSYAVDMQIRVLAVSESNSDIAFQARAARSGPAMLQEFQHYIVLLHPEMRLVVDRSGRTIHLNAAHLDAPIPAAADPAGMLAKAQAAGYSVDVDQQADGIEVRFTADTQPSFQLTFDTAELRLQRMEMQNPAKAGESPGRTVVTYTWHMLDQSHRARMQSDYYVQRVGDTWRPTAAFEGYRVVVSREN
jgi:hypothetical protein